MSKRINDRDAALAQAHYQHKVLRRLRRITKGYKHKPPAALREEIGETRHWHRISSARVSP